MTEGQAKDILDPINKLIEENAASMAQASKEGNMQALGEIRTGTLIDIVDFLGSNPHTIDEFVNRIGGKK